MDSEEITDVITQIYLPYFGHFLMAVGYIVEHLGVVDPPFPSGVILIGHLCVLADPGSLSPEKPTNQLINIILLISNIMVFIYDFFVSLHYDIPTIEDLDCYMP